MKVSEFFYELTLDNRFIKTEIDSRERIEDIFTIASAMEECANKSIALAFCYANGYGVKKDLDKFKNILTDALKYYDIRIFIWLKLVLKNGLMLNKNLIKLDADKPLLEYVEEKLKTLTVNYLNSKKPIPTLEEIKLKELKERYKGNPKDFLNKAYENKDYEELYNVLVYNSKVSFDQLIIGLITFIDNNFIDRDKINKIIRKMDEKMEFEDEIIPFEGISVEIADKLISLKYYEECYLFLAFYSDMNCLENTDGYVLEKQAVCLAETGRVELAIQYFLAALRNDHTDVTIRYLKKFEII